MDLKQFITKMNEQAAHYRTSTRKERAALLVWFLINYYRIDEDTAIDLVCDSDNDKGIDGIFVDDQTEEIYIFQSKNSPNPASSQGDNDLRNFKVPARGSRCHPIFNIWIKVQRVKNLNLL
jgi:hypothetical protein